jgi:hypothetical protein
MIKQIQRKINKTLLNFRINKLNQDLRSIAIEYVHNNKVIKESIKLKPRQKELMIEFKQLKRLILRLKELYDDDNLES